MKGILLLLYLIAYFYHFSILQMNRIGRLYEALFTKGKKAYGGRKKNKIIQAEIIEVWQTRIRPVRGLKGLFINKGLLLMTLPF